MNVGIIGLGLIGGSIALKIKEIDKNTVIYGLDKDMDSMSYSLSKGIIDKKLDIKSIDNLKFNTGDDTTTFKFMKDYRNLVTKN